MCGYPKATLQDPRSSEQPAIEPLRAIRGHEAGRINAASGGVQKAYVLMVDNEHQHQHEHPISIAQHMFLDPADQQPAKHSNSSATSLSSHSKVQFLDGVRGLAAVLVVAQHCGYLSGVEVGQCGVGIFFVLSVFLLTMLLYRKSETLLAQQASYRKWLVTVVDYLSKRFFRVYPLVATVVWLLPAESKRQFFFVNDPRRFELLKVFIFEFPYHAFGCCRWRSPIIS